MLELELDLEGEGQALWNLSSSAKNIDCVKTVHTKMLFGKWVKLISCKNTKAKKEDGLQCK